MRWRTAHKRTRRKASTHPHIVMTDRKWYWTWERDFPGVAIVPFRGYRAYGRRTRL